jgi:ribose 5-phosphate isomerase B
MKMIAIGNDHAGINLKEEIKSYFDKKGIQYKDFGVVKGESCDYPDMAGIVSYGVASGEFDKGILICGTGVGMSMTANKVKGIRAVCCSDYFSAKASRQHNNSNILCIGERVLGASLALEIVEVFLETEFESGGRHANRIEKMMKYDEDCGF